MNRYNLLAMICSLAMLPGIVVGQVTNSFTEPFSTNEIAASEPGIIAKSLVREGDRVKKNQVLAQLNCEVLEQSLKIAKLRASSDAQVRAAKATVKLHKKNYDTLKPLLASGHANPAEVEQAQAALEQAAAELELAKEKMAEHQLEVHRIEAQINQRRIRSPIDGIIVEIHRRQGESIAASEPRFATVVQLDQLRVRFYLLQKVVNQLRKKQTVQLTINDGKNKTVSATIEFISPVIDPKSGTARVDVLLNNRLGNLRSGNLCQWQGFRNNSIGKKPQSSRHPNSE